jgi:hypothetical protein
MGMPAARGNRLQPGFDKIAGDILWGNMDTWQRNCSMRIIKLPRRVT